MFQRQAENFSGKMEPEIQDFQVPGQNCSHYSLAPQSGRQTSQVSITWELAQNAESRAHLGLPLHGMLCFNR